MIFQVGFIENKEKYLADLPKRIQGLALDSTLNSINEPLWILWCNIQLTLPAIKDEEYYTEVLHMLAFMAYKIELYSVNNMLTDSPSIRKILWEMKRYIFLDLNFFRR